MELSRAMKDRRSIRRYSQEKVGEAELREIAAAGALAPTGGNSQALRFIAISSPEMVARIFPLTAWAARVKPRRTPALGVSAPNAFIALTAPGEEHAAAAGAAIQNMMLRAVELGLGTCWIGAFDRGAAAAILAPEGGRKVLFLLAVGHPDEQPVAERASEGKVAYYLDDDDVLHVPKLPLDELLEII